MLAAGVERCRRCGRSLRDPQSIAEHIGPVCKSRISADKQMELDFAEPEPVIIKEEPEEDLTVRIPVEPSKKLVGLSMLDAYRKIRMTLRGRGNSGYSGDSDED